MDLNRIKMYHVHLSTPHDGCNHYVGQTCTNKNKKFLEWQRMLEGRKKVNFGNTGVT